MDANYDKDGWATAKAIILSKAMRKITNLIGREKILLIFTNQLRQKLNAMAFADPWTTSGGKALAFHSTIRMRLAVKGKIKKGDDIVGIKIEAKIIKNRIGPPFRKATFDMYFDSGIDHYSDWLEALQTRKIVTKSGQTYSFDWVDITTGEVIKKDSPEFTSKEFPALMESNQEVKDYLYQRLCDASIMKYKDPTMSRLDDDTEVEDGTIEE
jgi:recombination protein RecA